MKTKRIMLVIVAALVALSAVGVASAQQTTTPDAQRGFGRRGHAPIMNSIRNVLGLVSESTGLDRVEIVAQLADGKTLSEVITENGGSVEDVTAQIMTQISERLVTAVENERITQERADELLANAETHVNELLNRVFERLTQRELPGERRGPQGPGMI
ncbi:MAG: hypothetical protein IPK52_01755 [Chloroflexi bacterium]|nr:hypothetical protein [Chloroflexota bacterium]